MGSWIIKKTYNDTGEFDDSGNINPNDEFTSRLRVDKNQQWGIANARGIRTLAAGKDSKKIKKNHYSCIVLVTNYVNMVYDNPWTDKLEENSGDLEYWGDARFHGNKRVDDWHGNKWLVRVHEEILLKNTIKIPPFLYFRRYQQGQVTFFGAFILEDLVKQPYYDDINDELILNYLCIMKRLPEKEIFSEWIVHRAKFMNDNTEYAPESWKKYLKTI